MDEADEIDAPSTSAADEKAIHKKLKPKKPIESGVCFLQSVPEFMTARKLRELLSAYGELGKIYLQPETRKSMDGKKKKKYTEGWIEFKDKRLAKRIAASFNNTPIGGKRRSRHQEMLWNIKYLHRFKWIHLTEQLSYERAVNQQRLRTEVTQAKRHAAFFAAQVDKGANLRKIEEMVLKKGGKWEQYQRQIHQRKTVSDAKNRTEKNDKMMDMIF